MQIETALLETLCCPVGKTPLRPITREELERWNTLIAHDRVEHACGARVDGPLVDALIAAEGTAVYPIRDGVPVLVPCLRIVAFSGSGPRATLTDSSRQADPWADRWEELSHRWDDLGPPIRPALEDNELLHRLVREELAASGRPHPRALLLGVTPEIATMSWPAGTRLLALDSSEAMVRNVWPAGEVRNGVAALADWLTMPVRDAAYDIVVGDGSLSVPTYPSGGEALVREIRRVLKDDGALAVRMFTRPETPEPVEAVFADLRAGRIGTIDAAKWRLAMALHGDVATGARMGDIWDAWEANISDPAALMRSLGWPPETPDILTGLRGLDARITFPTLAEVRAILSPEFEEAACLTARYADGERYPTMLFRPAHRS